MDTAFGIAQIPYGAEIVYREPRNNADVGANANAPRPLVDNMKTVQRLQDLGALSNQDKQSILALKAIVDEQIKIVTAEKERIPSAVGQRVIHSDVPEQVDIHQQGLGLRRKSLLRLWSNSQ